MEKKDEQAWLSVKRRTIRKKWYTFEIREEKLSIEEWQHDVYSREL